MQAYKTKLFSRWAIKEGLSDEALLDALEEIEQGLVDANLGGHVYKKRVAIQGRGKSGGVRTLLAYKVANKAFFIYGFAKNARSNIEDKELKALKLYASTLLQYNDGELKQAVKSGALIAIES
jgi:hypothetical protein